MGRNADVCLHWKYAKPGHGQHLGSRGRGAGSWFFPLHVLFALFLCLSLWLCPGHVDVNQRGPSPLWCRASWPLLFWCICRTGSSSWWEAALVTAQSPTGDISPRGNATDGSPCDKALSRPCTHCFVPVCCGDCPSLPQFFIVFLLIEGAEMVLQWRRESGNPSPCLGRSYTTGKCLPSF